MEKKHKNGWDYIKISGTPLQRGKQHGELLAERICESIDQQAKIMYLETGMDWEYFRSNAVKLWGQKICTEDYREYYEEMEGIANGVQSVMDRAISWEDILTWNAYEELVDYWFPTVAQEAYRDMARDGSSRMPHNAS